MNKNEAFSRVVIDAQLASQGWNTQDQNSVRYEVFVALVTILVGVVTLKMLP